MFTRFLLMHLYWIFDLNQSKLDTGWMDWMKLNFFLFQRFVDGHIPSSINVLTTQLTSYANILKKLNRKYHLVVSQPDQGSEVRGILCVSWFRLLSIDSVHLLVYSWIGQKASCSSSSVTRWHRSIWSTSRLSYPTLSLSTSKADNTRF